MLNYCAGHCKFVKRRLCWRRGLRYERLESVVLKALVARSGFASAVCEIYDDTAVPAFGPRVFILYDRCKGRVTCLWWSQYWSMVHRVYSEYSQHWLFPPVGDLESVVWQWITLAHSFRS